MRVVAVGLLVFLPVCVPEVSGGWLRPPVFRLVVRARLLVVVTEEEGSSSSLLLEGLGVGVGSGEDSRWAVSGGVKKEGAGLANVTRHLVGQ